MKYNGNKFSVYESEEKTVLGLLDELGSQVNHNTDNLKNKTDLYGDHKGSWQGLNKPTLSEEGMRATVEKISETDIPRINEQLDNKTNLTNKRVEIMNEKTDIKGVIDLANFAGQGTQTKDIMSKFHNYTDSDIMWLDNVGEGNVILRLNNSRNPIRREDKESDYVGSGTYLQCGKHATDGSKYYLMFELDKDGNINWDGQRAASSVFTNLKLNVTDIPAFIFRTPSGRHDKIATFQTAADNREVLSIGVHANGTLAEIDLGEKMTSGLVFNLPSGTSLQSGIGGKVRTIPNVRIQNYAPTSIAPEFIGQFFLNTAQASQGLHPSVYIGWGTDVGNWVALD